MGIPVSNGRQAPLNLVMPIGSWFGVNVVKLISYLKTRMFLAATDQIGTVHYLRFIDLRSDNQLGFFTAYDGDFSKYIQDFVRCLGPVFDAVFKFVINPPRTPVAKNADELIDWIAAHNRESIGFYSAYPTLTVQDIKARSLSGTTEKAGPSPMTIILPIKTPADSQALEHILPAAMPNLFQAADDIGTVHFARFIPLSSTRLAFVSDVDGDAETYIRSLSKHLGPFFDTLLGHVVDPPPLPVEKNAEAFVRWMASRNLPSSVYYSAYPRATARDIRMRVAAA